MSMLSTKLQELEEEGLEEKKEVEEEMKNFKDTLSKEELEKIEELEDKFEKPLDGIENQIK